MANWGVTLIEGGSYEWCLASILRYRAESDSLDDLDAACRCRTEHRIDRRTGRWDLGWNELVDRPWDNK